MKMKTRNIIMALALVCVLLVGGIFAYLTDAETATNQFSVGQVDITLTEPHFVQDEAYDLYAGETVAKDPVVTNDGLNDAYVYVRVTVPKANVVTANDDGTKNASAVQQLFKYTVNAGWTLLEQDTTTNTSNNYYLYAYDAVLPVGQSTSKALFDNVTLVNLVEGQVLPNVMLDVKVDAYAIQSDFASAKTAAEAFELYAKQNGFVLAG